MNLIVLFFGVVLASAFGYIINPLEDWEWDEFKVKFSKTYESPDEEMRRKSVFLENKKLVEEHNRRYADGLVTYKAGLNHLSDMRAEEVLARMTGVDMTSMSDFEPIGTFMPPQNVEINSTVDWRTEGAVTPVKNQGTNCGSCWAFSSTGALEGQVFRKTGKLVSLSEQNLVDCSTAYGTHGCHGGWMGSAFQYIKKNDGIDSELLYPYEAIDTDTCRYSAKTKAATDSGYIRIKQDDEEALMQAVATVGPISVIFKAVASFVSYYQKEVYYEPNCHSLNGTNHAVLIVGYGDDASEGAYWLVKNSWGVHWGDAGYIKMARNRGNMCGIASWAIYPYV